LNPQNLKKITSTNYPSGESKRLGWKLRSIKRDFLGSVLKQKFGDVSNYERCVNLFSSVITKDKVPHETLTKAKFVLDFIEKLSPKELEVMGMGDKIQVLLGNDVHTQKEKDI
jgi:hypothetical protein